MRCPLSEEQTTFSAGNVRLKAGPHVSNRLGSRLISLYESAVMVVSPGREAPAISKTCIDVKNEQVPPVGAPEWPRPTGDGVKYARPSAPCRCALKTAFEKLRLHPAELRWLDGRYNLHPLK